MALTEKSRLILEAIAKGHTYEQILVQELAWTYHDIFQAASEALGNINSPPPEVKSYRVSEIRNSHPHAYEKWDTGQDEQLRKLFYTGKTVKEIGLIMQRQPGGIKSRIAKLNLIAPENPI